MKHDKLWFAVLTFFVGAFFLGAFLGFLEIGQFGNAIATLVIFGVLSCTAIVIMFLSKPASGILIAVWLVGGVAGVLYFLLSGEKGEAWVLLGTWTAAIVWLCEFAAVRFSRQLENS